ncbi:hypothetical protein K227x_34640 [Rubripirellula lacrimiformis]|uniref:Uncharacterized protein n=1 Tax=Rubripirellula lacrimiformis TaxID=1930273 RepID=A0A517ND86_9BACT|nr:hypothetical protein K227x_34640 [Rubripirellula lacrimiformis]
MGIKNPDRRPSRFAKKALPPYPLAIQAASIKSFPYVEHPHTALATAEYIRRRRRHHKSVQKTFQPAPSWDSLEFATIGYAE